MSDPAVQHAPFRSMTQVNEWLALMRAHEGGITKLGDIYLKHGERVACHLTAAITQLVVSRHLALSTPDATGMQRVCVTHAGQRRFAQLNGHSAGRRDERQ